MSLWIGFDISGTFTDIILFDGGARVIGPAAAEVTPFSVAAHMVHEVEHPYLSGEPIGCSTFRR